MATPTPDPGKTQVKESQSSDAIDERPNLQASNTAQLETVFLTKIPTQKAPSVRPKAQTSPAREDVATASSGSPDVATIHRQLRQPSPNGSPQLPLAQEGEKRQAGERFGVDHHPGMRTQLLESAIEKMIQQSAENRDNHRAQMLVQEERINEMCEASKIAREEMEEEARIHRKVRFAPSLEDWTDSDEADKLLADSRSSPIERQRNTRTSYIPPPRGNFTQPPYGSRPQPLSLGAFLPKERQRRGAPTATEAAAAPSATATATTATEEEITPAATAGRGRSGGSGVKV